MGEPPDHSHRSKVARALGQAFQDVAGGAQPPAQEDARRFDDPLPPVRWSAGYSVAMSAGHVDDAGHAPGWVKPLTTRSRHPPPGRRSERPTQQVLERTSQFYQPQSNDLRRSFPTQPLLFGSGGWGKPPCRSRRLASFVKLSRAGRAAGAGFYEVAKVSRRVLRGFGLLWFARFAIAASVFLTHELLTSWCAQRRATLRFASA